MTEIRIRFSRPRRQGTTDRPIKITFSEPVAEADPSNAFPRRQEESAGST
jgi:hypothetical protein